MNCGVWPPQQKNKPARSAYRRIGRRCWLSLKICEKRLMRWRRSLGYVGRRRAHHRKRAAVVSASAAGELQRLLRLKPVRPTVAEQVVLMASRTAGETFAPPGGRTCHPGRSFPCHGPDQRSSAKHFDAWTRQEKRLGMLHGVVVVMERSVDSSHDVAFAAH